MQKGPHQGRKL